MNKKQKFMSFLESLKGNGQDKLVESMKRGIQVCFENEELRISAVLIDSEATEINKGKVIKSNITVEEFDKLAKQLGFNRRVQDTRPLAGYYYANYEGDTLVSYPSYHKEGDLVHF